MVENLPDGSTMVPMFLSKDEAEGSMKMALEKVDDEDKSKFQVNVLPLTGAIQMQAIQKEGWSAKLKYRRALGRLPTANKIKAQRKTGKSISSQKIHQNICELSENNY